MAQYPQLAGLVRTLDPRSSHEGFIKKVVPYLVDVWLDDYFRTGHTSEIGETTVSEFSYLFDIGAERLIAAWGISKGRHGEARDASRMAGHPLSSGPLYHRGHAIPHTLGGPTDINLVPQLGKINIGPFRPLEKKAVATPGSFYFTYWSYLGAARGRGAPLARCPLALIKGYLCPVSRPKSLTTVTDGFSQRMIRNNLRCRPRGVS